MSLAGEERKAYILEQLNAEGQVKTLELVKHLGVSSETIRRYLEELELDNRLKRVYGGAIKISLDNEEPTYMKREVLYMEEKRRIGKAAAELVEDYDVIFIDDGTTPMQMIHYLMNKKNLTVLTISIATLHLLMEYKNKELFSGDIYFIGGKVNAAQSRVSGLVAERMLAHFNADKAFVSVDGIVLNGCINSFDAERGQLVSRMIEQSKQTIVMTDSSKIGQTHLYRTAEWRQINMVICEVPMPRGWQQTLEEHEVGWIVAE